MDVNVRAIRRGGGGGAGEIQTPLCVACQNVTASFAIWACQECQRRLPPSLIKAAADPFDYLLRLRDGTVVRFMEARFLGAPGGEWVTLLDLVEPYPYEEYTMPRGFDVRIADIVWCTDAPQGS